MSLYDEENPLLLQRPRPFWEEEEPVVSPVVVQPPVAPPAAPPPEVEGPGYASPEDITAVPEVEGPGFASLEDIPGVREEPPPPEVEGSGYASLEEIPGAKPEEEEGFLKKAGRVALATGQLLAPNLGQAKAVLEPETQKAAIDVAEGWKKDLQEAPANLSDFWKKMQTRWAMGKEQATDDQLAYKAATGEVKWEDIKDQLEPSPEAQKAKGEHWYSEGLLQATEMVPAMLDSLYEGSKQGLQWGGAAAASTAIAGQLGPQVALPEELATVPLAAGAGYAGGQAYGSFEYWRRQGTGSLYNDLRKEGIGHEVAKNVSATFGVPYAGIEFLQLTKLVPGMKQAASHAIGEGIKKRLIALGKEKLGEYGEQIGQETSQELMQATSEALAEWKDGITPPPEKKGILERAWNTIVQTSAAMPFLMGPKAVTDVTGAVVGERAIAVAQPPVVTPVVAPGIAQVPPPIPPTPPEVFAPSGVTITPAPGEVPVPPDLAGAPAAAAVPAVPPPLPSEIGPDTAAKTVAYKVQSDNEKVTQVADVQAQNLQASAAPKTAEVIQQVAQASNTEASITAAEFLVQAQRAAVEGAPPVAAVPEAEARPGGPAVTAPTGDERFAPPAAVTPVAVAPPAAPAPTSAAPTSAAPTPTETPAAPAQAKPAVVVGGQVFTGDTPAEARIAAHQAVGGTAMGSATTGWVDEGGRFTSHETFDTYQDLNTAMEGGDVTPEFVQQAEGRLAQAQARDTELNNQIVQPGGEQIIQPGIKGQEAVISVRPSQELAVPLAGVNVSVTGVTPEGKPTIAQRPAAQALNDSRNDRTALTILLNCLT